MHYAFKVKAIAIANDSYSSVYVPDYSTANLYLFLRGSFRPEPSRDPCVRNNDPAQRKLKNMCIICIEKITL